MQATPRVNSALLSKYPSRSVKLVGEVLRLDGNSALIMASDKGQVTVHLNPDTSIGSTLYVEVIGRVNAKDNSIQALTTVDLGDKIDMESINKVVELTHKYPNIFPEE